jgi:hypothetical protein
MMTLESRRHLGALVIAVLVLAGYSAAAEDKKDKEDKDKASLSGVWTRKEHQLKIEFADKEVMKISPHGKDEVILIVCKYTLEKNGLVKAKITELEGKEKEKAKDHVPVDLEFSFKWQVKKDTATLGDVSGDNVEALKQHLEGDYEQKK